MENDEKERKIMKKQRKILENEENVRKNEGQPMKNQGKVKEKVRKPCPRPKKNKIPKTRKKTSQKKSAPFYSLLATRDTPTCWWSILFFCESTWGSFPFSLVNPSNYIQKFIPDFHHCHIFPQCQGKEIQFKMCLRPTVTSESRGGASFRKVRGLVHVGTRANKVANFLWKVMYRIWRIFVTFVGVLKEMCDVARRKEKELLTWDVWMRRSSVARESVLH